MSTASWMHGGVGKLLLEVPPAPPYPTIKVYDIDDLNFVGVEYPGKDRQAQPRIWWEERLRKAPPPPPKIQPRKRPEAQGASPSVAATAYVAPPAPRATPKIKPRSKPDGGKLLQDQLQNIKPRKRR